MKYPMLCSWIRIQPGEEDGCVFCDDLLEARYRVDRPEVAHLAMRLDGRTDPYRIPTALSRDEVTAALREMQSKSMIRVSRVSLKAIGSIYYALFIFRKNPWNRTLSILLNALRILVFLPLFIVGTAVIPDISTLEQFPAWQVLPGLAIGLLAGTVLHEAAHMTAGLAAGAAIYEAGISFTWFLPSAYVMLNSSDPLLSRQKKIQIDLAGVEANLALCGIFRIIAAVHTEWYIAMSVAALINEVTAMANLGLLPGLDGCHAAERILGVAEIRLFSGTGLLRGGPRPYGERRADSLMVLICGLLITLIRAACFVYFASGFLYAVSFIFGWW